MQGSRRCQVPSLACDLVKDLRVLLVRTERLGRVAVLLTLPLGGVNTKVERSEASGSVYYCQQPSVPHRNTLEGSGGGTLMASVVPVNVLGSAPCTAGAASERTVLAIGAPVACAGGSSSVS